MSAKKTPGSELSLLGVIGKRSICLQINHVWLGDGAVLFLECGALQDRMRRDGNAGNPIGASTIMIEPPWRISSDKEILWCSGGYHISADELRNEIVGTSLREVVALDFARALLCTLSNSFDIRSFTDEKSESGWSVLFNDGGYPKSAFGKSGNVVFQ